MNSTVRSVATVNPKFENTLRVVDSFIFGKALACGERIPKATRVFSYSHLERVFERNAYTIEVSDGEHICDTRYLSKLNHSCEPNLLVCKAAQTFIAVRDIEPEEPLTYFYPSTESQMAVPFRCNCQSSRCIGIVRGADALGFSLPRDFILDEMLCGSILE